MQLEYPILLSNMDVNHLNKRPYNSSNDILLRHVYSSQLLRNKLFSLILPFQICQEEEFLQLSAFQLINLIRKDELNVQEEREVYNSVLKWVKYDEDARYPKMEHILYAVRCQFLTPQFLKDQMKNCTLLQKAPACREYLARIFKDLTLHKRPPVKERTPNTTRMIFIAGGYNKFSLDLLEGFNVDDKVWITLPKLTVPRSGNNSLFIFL
jgi:kelch-like protein 19